MAFIVYWVRLAEHDDPYSEGYVGISSKSLDERKQAHHKSAKSNVSRNLHFHNAILRYGKRVIWEILHDNLTEDEAFLLEGIYREDVNVGWNSDRGGVKAVSPEWYKNEDNKEKHRQATANATRRRIAEKDSQEARSMRAREIWSDEGYRKKREGLNAGANNPQFGRFGESHPAYGHTKTLEGRAAISAAHKGKFLSIDTRSKISAARSKVSDEIKSEMYSRRMKGEQSKIIARDYDCDSAYVTKQVLYWRRKNELPEPPPIIEWELNDHEVQRLSVRGEKAIASKFTNAQRSDICKRRAQGESYKSIGDSFGKGFSTIANICKNWGPENGYPFEELVAERKQKFTKEKKGEMCRRHARGEKLGKIAKGYDTTFQNVHYICRTWGPLNGFPSQKKMNAD